MINIDELRRLTQEATPGPWKACRNHEYYEGTYFEIDPEDEAEYAAKPFTHIEARTGVVVAAHDLFEFDSANAAFIAAANPAAISELLDRLEAVESDGLEQARLLGMSGEREAALLTKLEAAEKERDALRAELAQLHKEADKFGDGIDWIQRALQAEAQIEQMERQEPVAWLHETRRDSDVVTDAVKHVWGKAVVGALAAYSIPLYALPGTKGEEK